MVATVSAGKGAAVAHTTEGGTHNAALTVCGGAQSIGPKSGYRFLEKSDA
jgi:hypothetical protein